MKYFLMILTIFSVHFAGATNLQTATAEQQRLEQAENKILASSQQAASIVQRLQRATSQNEKCKLVAYLDNALNDIKTNCNDYLSVVKATTYITQSMKDDRVNSINDRLNKLTSSINSYKARFTNCQ
jgi:hypothetical protein